MNKKKFVFLTALWLITTALPLLAQEFLSHSSLVEAAKSITLEKYPNSEFVLIDDYIQDRYQPNGTGESWDDTAVKILTEKGRRKHVTMELYYNISYGSKRFTLVEVIKQNGTVTPLDIEVQSKEMIDPGSMRSNRYNTNSKRLTLSVPDLEVGDILRYVTQSIFRKAVVPDTWDRYMPFEETFPIEQLTYEVIAPKSLPLKKIILKKQIPFTVTTEEQVLEDSIVYTWKVKNVPRMLKEPKMPHASFVGQHLLLSTNETWEDLSIWYWNLIKPRLFSTTPEMLDKARELTQDCTTTREKIESVFRFVSQEIRYMGITTETEAPGYEPHDVHTTFEKRYGVCRDKAALLAAMLRLVDIEAFPAMMQTRFKLDKDIPVQGFNHAITVALENDGSYILMDSTDETTKDIFPAYLHGKDFLVARPEGETLLTSPIIPAENNLLQISTTASISLEGTLAAESRLLFEGINDNWFRSILSKKKPKERHRIIEGLIKKSIPTAILDQLSILPENLQDITQPLIIKFNFTAKNIFIGNGNKKMLILPKVGGSFSYVNKILFSGTQLEKRTYPFHIRFTAGIKETLNLEFPGKIGKITVPQYQAVDSPELTWNQVVLVSGNQLNNTSTLLLKKIEFNPERYLEFKKHLKIIEYDNRKKVILEDVPIKDSLESNVCWLNRERIIQLTDTSNWVEIHKNRIKILTYTGKKNHSEKKYSFNSAWQNIVITNATVTAPNGTVKTLSNEEINIMDKQWVASAPRYPAEKVLVVSFPAVEIGSIIDYEIRSTVSGKPFFSIGHRFNGFEPVKEETVTVSTPVNLPLKIWNTGPKQPEISSKEATTSYTWNSSNQPIVNKEDNLPKWWCYNPGFLVSTGTWQGYANLVQNKLLNATYNQPVTEALAHVLTKGIVEKKGKVYAIRNWVAKNIRQAGPVLTRMPLSAITPADQTLHDRYGNETDRAILLYTQLKTIGFKPTFILISKQSLITEAYQPLLVTPQRTALRHVLVKLKVEGENLFLDSSSQYSKLGTTNYENQPLLNLELGEIEFLSVALDKQTRTNIIYDINILANGQADVRIMTKKNGINFKRFKQIFSEITPKERQRLHLKMVANVSQAAEATSELITDYSTYPGHQQFSVKADRYAVLDGDYLYFTLPTNRVTSLLKYRANKRNNPLAWNQPVRATIEYNIRLPENYQIEIIPSDYTWNAPYDAGAVAISARYDHLDNSIHIIHQADLKPALLPASVYPELLKVGQHLSHPKMNTILLKVKNHNMDD